MTINLLHHYPLTMRKIFYLPILLALIISKSNAQENQKVVLKFKPQYRNLCTSNGTNNDKVLSILIAYKIEKLIKIFPTHTTETNDKKCHNCVDLSLMYEINLQINNSKIIRNCIKDLINTDYFEYVELKEKPHLLGNVAPNDPLKSNQYYVTDTIKLQLYKAWGITEGDTNVVIGVTDTGVEWQHEDIIDNIKNNLLDPINGIDDDLDGYADNYRGWDLNGDNNNPTDLHGHGTICGGISSAKTNNNKGVAGIGYKCKLLPIRVGNSTGGLSHSYEGIVYGADHGCKIINCSWGAITTPSKFGQDIIDYATFNKDVVIIAAAGNANSEDVFYPAGYKNVIAVANLTSTDNKFIGSSFGYNVGVSAPGSNMFTTFKNNVYGGLASPSASGTSFAAPVVSGIAGLTRSKFPNENALATIARIRASCDNIYSLNFQYLNKLGQGRVNAYKAVTWNNPSPLLVDYKLVSSPSSYFQKGDTIKLFFKINNYVSAAANFRVTASTLTNQLQAIGLSTWVFPFINVNDSVQNILSASFIVKQTASINEPVAIKLSYFNNNTTPIGFDVLKVNVNTDYINLVNNELKTTITSKGQYGYADATRMLGNGFEWQGQNLLNESSFMIGNSTLSVMDNFRNVNNIDQDFFPIQLISENGSVGDLDLFKTSFSDANAPINRLNIEIKEDVRFPTNNSVYKNFIIKKYKIINKNNFTISNIHAAIAADWDILNPYLNKSNTDIANLLCYTFNTQNNTHAGVAIIDKPLTSSFKSYAIDNNVTGGGINVMTNLGFNDSLKFVSMSTSRLAAGNGNVLGDDVMQITGVGPISLIPNDSVIVTFAFVAASSLFNLQQTLSYIKTLYNNVNGIQQTNRGNQFLFPNPVEDKLYLMQASSYSIYNVIGQLVLQSSVSQNIINVSSLPNGIYSLKTTEKVMRFIKN